jgi:magnesium transporter
MMPGVAVYVGPARDSDVRVRVLDYTPAAVRERIEPDDAGLDACLAPDAVAWVDLDGVHDLADVQRVAARFDLHPLWIEDILNPDGRPRVEQIGDRLFLRLRMLRPPTEPDADLDVETVCLVLGPSWVLTFQERPGDVWDPVRERIRTATGRIRRMGADYLLDTLLDAVVDGYLTVLEHLEARVARLEDDALMRPDQALPAAIAEVKAELDVIGEAVVPVRDALGALLRAEGTLIRPETVPFLRDVVDHVAQVSDGVDSMRERLFSAVQLSLAVSSHRLNEVMRVLTIVSTLFLPMTFLAGIWGMNFATMPELHQPWGYPFALGTMAVTAAAMLGWFRHKGWL